MVKGILTNGNRYVVFEQESNSYSSRAYVARGDSYTTTYRSYVNKTDGNQHYQALKSNGYRPISVEDFNNQVKRTYTMKTVGSFKWRKSL